MTDSQLCFAPATELAALIQAGDVSIAEVVNAHLDRIERRNPEIGAFVCVLAEEARAAADRAQRELSTGAEVGVLHGVPIAIKDLEDVAGVPTVAGSRTMIGSVASEDAILTERLRKTGAIILGKTNTPEFGHKGVTDNLVTGPASSPFVAGTNAGGSSGGAAAAVADGLAAVAQGGDGGGSIRIPAALCGVYGAKPTWGRVAHAYRPGAFLFTPFVSHGPLSRTVEDAAVMLDAIIGPHPRDPLSLPDDGIDLVAACQGSIEGLRIAYSPNMGVYPVDHRVRRVIDEAVGAFTDAGATVDTIDLQLGHSQQELALLWRRGISVQHAQMVVAFMRDGIDLLADGIEPGLREVLETSKDMSALDYKLDDITRTEVFDAIQDVFEDYDLLVSPTTAVPSVQNAPDGKTVGPAEVDGEAVDPLLGWCLTYIINLTGHPAASVPAGLTQEGSPVGMQIVAPRFRDDLMITASAAFERVRPWRDSYPGLRDADHATAF